MFLSLDGTFIVQLVNFAIFFALLNVVFLSPVSRAIRKRREYIKSVTTDYDRYQAEAKSLREQVERVRATAHREAEATIAQLRSSASQSAGEIASEYGAKVLATMEHAALTVAGEAQAARAQERAIVRQLADLVLERTDLGAEGMNYEAVAKWSDIISALLFIVVMVYLWIKYILPAVLAAQAKNNALIEMAEHHRDEAKKAIDALRHAVEGAERDAVLIRERARDQAQREADAIVAEAKTSGERSLRNAQGELDRARAAARVALRAELADKALDLARSEAQQRVDAPLNHRLVQAFVDTLERRGAN